MKKAFTLLEMLIVLGIIAVILSVLSVSFSSTQKKSRDAKRKGDIKALQSGLEQYYASCGYVYPTAGFSSIVCGTSPAVVSVMPVDPKAGTGYTYTPTGTTGFSICANSMESESPTGFCLYNQQ
jgi:type IV pilus assembly protein PilE